MIEGIYREIIEDSPVAFLHIKTEKVRDIYSKVKIIDKNKSFDNLFGYYETDIINLIALNNNLSNSLDTILKKALKEGKYSYTHYIDKFKLYLNIDIYKVSDDEFCIRFSELRKELLKLTPIIKNSPFIAWIKDKNGNFIDVNKKFLELTEKKYGDIIGKNEFFTWPKDIAKNFRKQDMLVIDSDEQYTFEDPVKLSQKEEKYYQIIKWPYRDTNNTLIGTIGMAVEITEKVKLRKSIVNNEKIFQEISDNLDDVIIIRDKEKAHFISNSFEKVFGFNPEKLYEDINSWHDEWEYIEFIDGSEDYDSKEVVSNTIRIRKDKFDKWILSRFVPIFDESGKIIKRIGTITDITTRKKLEDELESLRMDFIANLSHEIRTPVTLILSCIQVISARINKLKEEDRDYFNKYTSIMVQNSYRLLKLINNLIDTKKIDSGNFNYRPQNSDIVSFVENICMSVVDFIESKNMSIIFDTDTEEKIISFDLDNMERIILNLLSNAIKYNKPNGEIIVEISCKDDIRISIKDNGIGIPKDKQTRVFERFGQVKNKMKTEHEGSGIGLFIVKSLVELNGGDIILNSQLGKGSEFTIVLPDRVEDSEVVITKDESSTYKIDRMNVEFSDIYI